MTNQEFLESITQDGEEWRSIQGFEDKYAVSNYSRVASFPRKHNHGWVLKPHKASHGYMYVSLYDSNGKHKYIALHRLVAQAFIPNPSNYKHIDHKDGDKSNNSLSNLRWCTRSMNMMNPITRERNSKARIGTPSGRAKGVVQISGDRVIATYRTSLDAANALNIGFGGICGCCRGKQDSYAGFRWMWLADYNASCQ